MGMSTRDRQGCAVLQVGRRTRPGDRSFHAGTLTEFRLLHLRKAAVALHPGAMYRLGTAELNGSLGLPQRPKEGVKWLKRSAEHASAEFPHALHELALLHERGIENVLFVDLEYATELLAQASELGYAPSAVKLGECYEYGKMGCPMDAALSIHYYVSHLMLTSHRKPAHLMSASLRLNDRTLLLNKIIGTGVSH